jgi:hypothetical protein
MSFHIFSWQLEVTFSSDSEPGIFDDDKKDVNESKHYFFVIFGFSPKSRG